MSPLENAMSTKRLSKTVIEGGRYGRNKFERYQSNAELRAAERDYLKEVLADPEAAYEDEIPDRQHVYKGFSDKLRPMYRWLDAQVGRLWSEVRSEVFKTFDTRTTAGRHITFDHLLKEVVDTESGFDNHGRMANPDIPVEHSSKTHYSRWGISDYYVDTDGILRKPLLDRRAWRRSFRYQKVYDHDYRAAEQWLQNRMVMQEGGKYYWLVPTEGVWLATWFEPNRFYDTYVQHDLMYFLRCTGGHKVTFTRPGTYSSIPISYTIQTSGPYWDHVKSPHSFRQRGELTLQDLKVFKGFKGKIREDILAYGKGR